MKHRALSPTSLGRLWVPCLLAALLSTSQACGADTSDAALTPDGAATPAPASPTIPGPEAAEEASESSQPFDPSTLPAVVARIDGREVSRERLLEEVQGARTQLVQSGMPEAATRTREFYAQALEQVVADILLFQEAEREGLLATDDEIEQRLTAIESRVPEGQSFTEALAAQGMTRQELTDELRRTAALQKILQTKIAPRVTVDESSARAFYEQNLDRMQVPPRVRARHILLEVAPEAGEEIRQAARAKAEDLRSRLEQGADFAALAREHSEDAVSSQEGGELPWLMPGQTAPAFDQAVFSLEPGQLGPVVESRYGYHVVEVLEKQPEQTAPFEQVKDRILNRLREERARELLHAHVEELKAAHEVKTHL